MSMSHDMVRRQWLRPRLRGETLRQWLNSTLDNSLVGNLIDAVQLVLSMVLVAFSVCVPASACNAYSSVAVVSQFWRAPQLRELGGTTCSPRAALDAHNGIAVHWAVLCGLPHAVVRSRQPLCLHIQLLRDGRRRHDRPGVPPERCTVRAGTRRRRCFQHHPAEVRSDKCFLRSV